MKNNNKREIGMIVKEISNDTKSLTGFTVAIVALAGAILVGASQVPSGDISATACNSSVSTPNTATCNTTFEVNVEDSITVEIDPVETSATGNVGAFMRDQVDLTVSSNVSNGFTASMYSSSENAGNTKTNLTHTTLGDSQYISTLSSSTSRGSFPTDNWGYSLESSSLDGKTYGETDAGNDNSTYYPLTDSTSTPIKLIEAAAGTQSGSQSIYFGAKASAAKPSGTYRNTVVISVVTGTIEEDSSDPGYNPITPVNPVTPSTDIPNDGNATYTGSTGTGATQGVGISGTTGTTVATTTTNAGVTTTTVAGGDNTGSYVAPQGVSRSTEYTAASGTTQGDSILPIALAATAGVAATAGTFFFILAKKRDDDDDEEEA